MGKFGEEGHLWEIVPSSSGGKPPPSPRAACSNAVIGTNLYIFGGWDANTKDHLNDLSSFNSETREWELLFDASTSPEKPLPCPRRGASLLPLSTTELVLFGGSVGMMKPPLSDIWIFDLTTRTWREVAKAEGSPSVCRYRHVAWIVDERLWVFGGADGRALRNEMCCFDFSASTWEVHSPLGDRTPDPREASVSATFVFNSTTYLCIFGGSGPRGNLDDIWLLDVSSPQQWIEVSHKTSSSEDVWPSVRSFHGAVPLPPQQDGRVNRLRVVCGRTTRDVILNDVYDIHIEEIS